MIQLHLLNGAAAGRRHEAKEFPVSVGRCAGCTVALPEPGVFDRHLEIRFSSEGFSLVPAPEAVVTLNGARTEGALLHNGDVIGAGYAKLQFWLGVLPQRGLKLREAVTWLLIAGVGALQVYLLLRLLAIARS